VTSEITSFVYRFTVRAVQFVKLTICWHIVDFYWVKLLVENLAFFEVIWP